MKKEEKKKTKKKCFGWHRQCLGLEIEELYEETIEKDEKLIDQFEEIGHLC